MLNTPINTLQKYYKIRLYDVPFDKLLIKKISVAY